MSGYDDIRHMNRPLSRHPKMRREDRAKLFAPFDALTGFGASIRARDRVLSPRIIHTEEARERLNRKLSRLRTGDYVSVVYFLPVEQTEEGEMGEYLSVASLFCRLDEIGGRLHLDGATIPLEDIADLTCAASEE